MKKIKLLILSLQIVVLSVSSIFGFIPTKTSALSGSEFNPGRIIDDSVFFNKDALSVQDIQNFLNAKMPTCDTYGTNAYGSTTRANYGTSRGYPPLYTCLKDFTMDVPSKLADSFCPGNITGGLKSAAGIISDVSRACSINPMVILILLQKEQSLITDDWPFSLQYIKATGFACPDSALPINVDSNQNGCYDEYEGFFNQIYYGARQYQKYAWQPLNYNYRAGTSSYIKFHPNPNCGGSTVLIQNQATAGLYNYTPYQPNSAALNNLYGSGDGCSAYGNRNFWRMFIDWFGNTQTTTPYAWALEKHDAFTNPERTQKMSVGSVAPNGKVYMRLQVRNMGYREWEKSFMRIGTSRPNDRQSQFKDASWLNDVRAGQMTENTVSPGGIGTFDFILEAPPTTGTYVEYFNLVAENKAWLNDISLHYTLDVVDSVPPSNTLSTGLTTGQSLIPGQYLLSPDRQSTLVLQNDGNLVLYSNFKPVWWTGTNGYKVERLVMQADGNLVLYGKSGALWNTETSGNPGSSLSLQADGNLVLYNSNSAALWATYTIQYPNHLSSVNTTLPVGTLLPGQQIETANRKFRAILQQDGNFVIYSPNRALWATGTDGKTVTHLALQGDGNLVLYNGSQPIWNSRTPGFGSSSRLVMQQDGNLVLYDRFTRPTWNSKTQGQE